MRRVKSLMSLISTLLVLRPVRVRACVRILMYALSASVYLLPMAPSPLAFSLSLP